ncbi:hypothetical protein VFPBJ_04572 [Purpureocillium lilacinum]|uniref:Uncharacterized protein n=1 Tax=Purpureocillium lilacinum TaxID=33203 RepID=A0A179GWX1_PURLI|nr:hypothetical protein VFPBJ_04572 [Purpureocillium lilacinum]
MLVEAVRSLHLVLVRHHAHRILACETMFGPSKEPPETSPQSRHSCCNIIATVAAPAPFIRSWVVAGAWALTHARHGVSARRFHPRHGATPRVAKSHHPSSSPAEDAMTRHVLAIRLACGFMPSCRVQPRWSWTKS